RFSGSGGPRSAADVVNFADEMEIREMVWRYGDEKRVRKAQNAGRTVPPLARDRLLSRTLSRSL
ncbi:unnamed protein product, partial [Scytosiphon promiscuus]